MVLTFNNFQEKINRNLIEKVLLTSGFKQVPGEYNAFSKKINGKKYSVDVRQSYIKFYINKKLIDTFTEHEANHYKFLEQLVEFTS